GFEVSTDTGQSTVARIRSSTGRRRAPSSSAGTGGAPGRVDSAPTSSRSAPSATSRRACRAAAAGSRYRPPSANESGVALPIPITRTRGRSAAHSSSTPRRRSLTPDQAPRARPRPPGPRSVPGALGRGAFERALRLDGEDARDLLGVERLVVQESPGEPVELGHLRLQDAPGPDRAVDDDLLHLGVDEDRGLLAVVLLARELPAEEDVLFPLAERERAQLLGHPPLADHLARHL